MFLKNGGKIWYCCCGIGEKNNNKQEQGHMGVVKLARFFKK
jgi:hypothetical protein